MALKQFSRFYTYSTHQIIQICSNLQEDLVKSKVGSSESQLFYIKRFTWIFFSHVWHCKNSSDVGCKKEWCTLLEK